MNSFDLKWNNTVEISPPEDREFLAKWAINNETYKGALSYLPGITSRNGLNKPFIGHNIHNNKNSICNGCLPDFWAELPENMNEME